MCSYSLDQKEHVLMSLWSFQGAREQKRPPTEKNHRADSEEGRAVSQNSTACDLRSDEVDILLGESSHRTAEAMHELDAYRR